MVEKKKEVENEKGRIAPKWEGVRNLSRAEFEERKANGLCYTCGQRFGLGYRCPEKGFKLMVWDCIEPQEEGEEEEEQETEKEEECGVEEELWEMTLQGLTMCAMEGQQAKRTKSMLMEGSIEGVPILILIDSGASHNFISKPLLRYLEVEVTDTKPFSIKLGDGHRVISQGKCEALQVNLGEVDFEVEAFLFNTSGPDLVLGMTWLETLGYVTTHWKNLTMSFEWLGKKITLQGLHEYQDLPIALQEFFGRDKV